MLIPSDYIFFSINGVDIRMEKTNPINIAVKRQTRSLDGSFYHQIKSTVHNNAKTGYTRRVVAIAKKQYSHSRVVFKAYHPEWDLYSDKRIGHFDYNPTNVNINNLYCSD